MSATDEASGVVILLAKAIVSGILIAVVNVVAHRSPTLAGLIVALPVVTVLSAFWLWIDRASTDTIETFLTAIAWGLIPTFAFVVATVIALRGGLPLLGALAVGASSWVVSTVAVQGAAGLAR